MASLYRRNNSKVWWVRFQSNGVRIQRSSGTTLRTEAMRFLARAMEEERQRQGQDPIKVRFDRLCDEYRAQHLVVLKPRTQLNYLGHLQAFADHFGERSLEGDARIRTPRRPRSNGTPETAPLALLRSKTISGSSRYRGVTHAVGRESGRPGTPRSTVHD